VRNKNVVLTIIYVILVIFLVSCGNKEITNTSQDNKKDANLETSKMIDEDSGNSDISLNEDNIKTENDAKVDDGSSPGVGDNNKEDENNPEANKEPESIDYELIKPNEAGNVMVLMFHNFVEEFKPSKYDNGEYTTTFERFKLLLEELYEKDYRLVNLVDYIQGDIDVPAGKIPIIFTFDDGTSGQFNLVKENGKLVVNKQSAVGIIEEFNKTHPDFGKKGTFYINLAGSVFNGEGTIKERLSYLVENGYELGNHTYYHTSLKNISPEKVRETIGKNEKEIRNILPDYSFKTLSLPYGISSKETRQYIEKGEYKGTNYKNIGIMLVGAEATRSPFHEKFLPLSMSRVRASGISPVDYDFEYWVNNTSRKSQFVSDGDRYTVTVPKANEHLIKKENLKDKMKFIVY
jgi:peptidoglycan/xylan/chitin deacetylase (PgdA/CDA1 family)